jgi:hypothetical protein
MTTFHTVVLDIAPSPLGLLPRRMLVEHYCKTCRSRVATEDLVAHANTHTDQTSDENHDTH